MGRVGGLIGAATKLPLDDLIARSRAAGTALSAALATLRPLAVVLVICTALGLVGWLIQVAGTSAASAPAARRRPR